MPCLACGEDLPENGVLCWRCGARLGEAAEAPANKRVAVAQYKEIELYYGGPEIAYLRLGKVFLPNYERKKAEAKARSRQYVLAALSAHQDAGWVVHGQYHEAVDEMWTKAAFGSRPRFRGAKVRLNRLVQEMESVPIRKARQAVQKEPVGGHC